MATKNKSSCSITGCHRLCDDATASLPICGTHRREIMGFTSHHLVAAQVMCKPFTADASGDIYNDKRELVFESQDLSDIIGDLQGIDLDKVDESEVRTYIADEVVRVLNTHLFNDDA